MKIHEKLIEKASQANKKVVLPEGNDPRVVAAANKIIEKGVAESVFVLGTGNEITQASTETGIKEHKFSIINPVTSPELYAYAEEFYKSRIAKGKNISIEEAIISMQSRLFYGAMMTKLGDADAMVAGSIASTGDMLKAAFQVVGTTPEIKTASSCFIMDLKTPTPGGENTLLFADAAVIPNPDAETLVDIAMATVKTQQALIETQPKVAFISFSTKGSAKHPMLEKICKATEMMKKIVNDQKLDVIVDGELQIDAAIVPDIAASKCPDSPIKGNANILIFPDLNAANACYKITQRLAGASALGPALQGLARPINDLSRGCSVDDIVLTAAIAICQSIQF